MATVAEFYVTGGTLQHDAPSYVRRQADTDLYEALTRGDYCYVLTARQMGKSSLMLHTAARLRHDGVAVVSLDLQAVGQNLTVEQWYGGLLTLVGQQLGLEDELDDFWLDHPRLGPLQRWMAALQEVVLARRPGKVVVSIDEIDVVRTLPFSTDEFFAGIRECYNRRTQDPEYRRLTFCLLGVAAPADLISDTRTSPFNIGRRIVLTDFTASEAAPLAVGLAGSLATESSESSESRARTLLGRILYWTGGHPYLTQRLCRAISETPALSAASDPNSSPSVTSVTSVAKVREQTVDGMCEALFFTREAREADDNLAFVRNRLLRSEVDLAALLDLYQQIRHGKRIADDETNPLAVLLKLSGVCRTEGGALRIRNRIYERVFDRDWVAAHMPDAELRRQRAAYRRGLFRAAGVGGVVVLAMAALTLTAVTQARRADRVSRSERAQRGLAQAGQRELRHTLYATQTNLAQQELDAGNRTHALELLLAQRPQPGQEDLRGFEWRLLWGRATRDDAKWVLSPEQSRVFDLAFSPDGRSLATAGSGRDVRVWDLATRRGRFALPTNRDGGSIDYSPDGRLMATREGRHAKLWDAVTGRELATFSWNNQQTFPPRFSSSGHLLTARTIDDQILFWKVRRTPPYVERLGLFRPHRRHTGAWSYSPGASVIHSRGSDSVVQLWDVAAVERMAARGELRRKLPVAPVGTLSKVGPGPHNIVLSRDHKFLLTGSHVTGLITVSETATGRVVASLAGEWGLQMAFDLSPDGDTLAIGGDDGLLRIWSVRQGRELVVLTGHQNDIYEVLFSPDGRSLASGSADGKVRIWDLKSRRSDELVGHTDGIARVAISNDSRLLASAGFDKTIRLWELRTRKRIRTLKGHSLPVTWVTFSPDARYLVSSSLDQSLRVWATGTGNQILRLTRRKEASMYPAAFSPDGRRFIWADDDDQIRVWEWPSRREVARLKGHTDRVHYPSFSPDGTLLATGCGPNDGHLRVWDTRTWKQIRALPSRRGWAGPQAFSADGRWLAVVGGDFAVIVWEVGAWRKAATLTGYTNEVTSVGFTPDGRTLTTTGRDGVVRFWSTASWRQAAAIKNLHIVNDGCLTPDGLSFIGAGRDGRCIIWPAPTLREIGRTIDRIAHERATAEMVTRPDWAAAIHHLDALLKEKPEDFALLHHRADAHAELGQWREAAADYSKWLELGANRAWQYERCSVAEWAAGDLESYRRSCAAMLRLYQRSGLTRAADSYAHAALRVPAAIPDFRVALRLAEVYLRAEPKNSDALATLGAALYRAGRFDDAVRRLRAAIAADPRVEGFRAPFYLAMALAQIGRTDEARPLLDRARRTWEPRMTPPSGEVRARLDWDLRFELRMLAQEAARVVGNDGVTR